MFIENVSCFVFIRKKCPEYIRYSFLVELGTSGGPFIHPIVCTKRGQNLKSYLSIDIYFLLETFKETWLKFYVQL